MGSALSVTLTNHEVTIADWVARKRQVYAEKADLQEANAAEKERGDEYHRTGCLGELAAAKALDFYWNPSIGETRKGDLGNGIEIRTRARHGWDLYIKPNDPDDKPFVLVTMGEHREFRIVGWIMGRDGKQEKFYGDPHGTGRPTYWIPGDVLHPISELPYVE